tara:strand:+ start:876 stop:1181 length:306 start_codon:yes stop_codon:yes gene_type:complete
MKKYLLLMLLTPFASADMDKICAITITDLTLNVASQIQEKECERDNILQVISLVKKSNSLPMRQQLLLISNKFCRFDRNADIEGNFLSCVLYTKRARGYQY